MRSLPVLVLVTLFALAGSSLRTATRIPLAQALPAAPGQACVAPRPVTPIGEGFFIDVSEASGIRDENFDPDPPDSMKINDHSRLAFADLNGDGFDDIVAHNLFPNPNQADPIPYEHLVFLNNGDGSYRNHSDASGLRDVPAGFFLFGDVDNDGDQDAFAGLDVPLPRADNAHRILLNDGAAHFRELPDSGVDVPFRDQTGNLIHYAGNAVFLDADGDADLDLYVGNGQTSAGLPDQLWMGNGDGTFRPASEHLQGPVVQRASNGSTTCDYDNDGDADIFVSVYGVSVDNGRNLLWESLGNGLFDNVARARGFEALATGNYFLAETGYGRDPEPGRGPGEYVGGNGFGLACEDLNNDGYADVFITNISHPVATDYLRTWSDPSQVLINQGPEAGFAFANEWLDRGLPFNEGDVDGSAVDFDNDGWIDLAISRDRKYEGSYAGIEQKSWFGLMHQGSDGSFDSVGPVSGINDRVNDPPELLRMKMAQNHAWSDVDGDGDLDLLVGGRSGGKAGRPNFLFRNEIGARNDWLAIRLEGDGVAVNRDAIGARVELVYPDRVLRREVKSSRGMYNSMDTRTLHFGLGDLGCDFSLRVIWPDRTVQTIPGSQVVRNAYMTLRYAGGEPLPTASPAPPSATPTPSPEPTATPPGDLVLAGRVLDASVPGFFMPLPGARVLARPDCLPRQAFEAITDAEGRYQLTVPADYANACESIELGARAEGFEPWQATIATSALRADPQRTIQLFRAQHDVTLWLPWLARSALR
ncbi:MAG: VCBS repeat-containing protein [Chloroflexi bacterium]|nr:VCBS repeat-containing protein [Chloroflexota bacterium]